MKHLIIVFFSALLVFSCHSNSEKQEDDKNIPQPVSDETIVELSSEQIKSLDIKTGTSSLKKMSKKLHLNGSINIPPQYTVSISAPFGGFVKQLSVQEGSPVIQGQQLTYIENPEYIQLQQDYLENLSQLGFLKSEYKRQSELSQDQINAKKTLQKAKADLDLLNAKLAGQRAKLKMLGIDIENLEKGNISSGVPIFAPVTGFVTAVNTNKGAYIGNTDVIVEMMDSKNLLAELAVYEKDLRDLKPGQKVKLNLAGENSQRNATVTLIGRKVNEDRTVHVYCKFDRADQNLRPGMFLKAEVEISNTEAVSVPENSIVNLDNKDFLFLAISDTRFELKEISKGIEYDGLVEISGGLENNSTVVVNGAFRLLAILKNSGEE